MSGPEQSEGRQREPQPFFILRQGDAFVSGVLQADLKLPQRSAEPDHFDTAKMVNNITGTSMKPRTRIFRPAPGLWHRTPLDKYRHFALHGDFDGDFEHPT